MDFKTYLGWCVDKVGSRSCIAEAHLRHTELQIRRMQKVDFSGVDCTVLYI
jgi:hypothetical protein